MANEIKLSYLSGYTVYAIVRNGTGQVYNNNSAAFETWNAANIGDYDIPLTDKSGNLYLGNFPSLAEGTYYIQFMSQQGGSPATTDLIIDTSPMEWSGTGEVTLNDISGAGGGSTWGAGAETVTLTIQDTDANNLSGVTVWVYSSNDPTQSLVTPRTTGAAGTVQFYLDDGVYYAFCYKQGYSFIMSGTTNKFTVSGTTSATLLMGQLVLTGSAPYYAESFLTRALADFREQTDEPQINAKYSDARVIRKLEDAYGQIAGDLARTSVTPVVAVYQITYADGTYVYRLPPTVQSVIAIYQTGDSGYRIFYDSRSHYNPAGRGVWLEGRAVHVQQSWLSDGAVIYVEYISQCPRLMNGTCTVNAAGTVVTLGAANQGTKDTRVNAYGGCLFRIIADSDSDYNYVQERTITSYDREESEATLDVALDPNPNGSGGTTYFEVLPPIPILMDRVVPLLAAVQVASSEGSVTRARLIRGLYHEAMRSVELQEFYTNLQDCAIAPQDNYFNRRFRNRYNLPV